jgi:hypothetical protein
VGVAKSGEHNRGDAVVERGRGQLDLLVPVHRNAPPRVFLEQIDPPDIAPQRIEALVPADLG